jgi:bifunctional non-homologous end joining protein LigD
VRSIKRNITAPGQAHKNTEKTRAKGQRRRITVQGRPLELANLDKLMYRAAGFTKAHVLDYYRQIATWLMPHLRARPLTLKRYPNGVDGEFFYEKRCPAHRPDWLHLAPVSEKDGGEVIRYCSITDLASLMWVANLASLELHLMLSRATSPDRPTTVIFDLDPGEPAGILQCAEVAFILHDVLADLHLASSVKTSGKKGLHVVVPLNTPITFDQTKDFARSVARAIEGRYKEQVVTAMRKDLRGGKVLIDWSQNDAHKTTVCVYSLRAIARPFVSTPVTWDELRTAFRRKDESRLAFEAADVLERVGEQGDLFVDVLTTRQFLPGMRPEELEHEVWHSNRSARSTQRRASSASRNGRRPAKTSRAAPVPSQPALLTAYRGKRHFERTPEPGPAGGRRGRKRRPGGIYVVHKHAARALHYDLRLEVDGVLKSWAVPRGPSLNPAIKRLAVRVEDHPMAYASLEGTIPEGQYGAGCVIVWDRGTWQPLDKEHGGDDPAAALAAGELKFWIDGEKIRGGYVLVRTAGRAAKAKEPKEQWLLIKHKDDCADPRADPTLTEPDSVLSGLWVEDFTTRDGLRSQRKRSAGRVSRDVPARVTHAHPPKPPRRPVA